MSDLLEPVTLTQFLRPDDWQTDVTTMRPAAIAEKARRIQEAGLRLTAEVLATGEVSMCIEGPESDLAIRVVPNGPGVNEALDGMIMAFDLENQEEAE